MELNDEVDFVEQVVETDICAEDRLVIDRNVNADIRGPYLRDQSPFPVRGARRRSYCA